MANSPSSTASILSAVLRPQDDRRDSTVISDSGYGSVPGVVGGSVEENITTPTNRSAPPWASRNLDSDANVNSMGERSLQPSLSQEVPPPDNRPVPVVPATAVHQPKFVQTAFIHKLYKYAGSRNSCLSFFVCHSVLTSVSDSMLEDNTIQHLSWTSTSDSFVLQPSHGFSKELE